MLAPEKMKDILEMEGIDVQERVNHILNLMRNDVKCVLQLTFNHYEDYNRKLDIDAHSWCFRDGSRLSPEGIFRRHYKYTLLKIVYFDNDDRLTNEKIKFIDPQYEPEKDAVIYEKIKDIKADNISFDHQIYYDIIQKKMKTQGTPPFDSYSACRASIVTYCPTGTNLDEVINYICPRVTMADDIDKFIINRDGQVKTEVRTSMGKKMKVFNSIMISINIINYGHDSQEMIKYLGKHIKEIYDKVCYPRLIQVCNKYGVPINFLKLDRLVYTKDSKLVCTFSLKEV